MKPADTKPKQIPKTEPAKPTQPTKTKSAPTAPSDAAAKPAIGKSPPKQDTRQAPVKQKTESKVSSGAAGKVAAAAVAGAVAAAGATVASTAKHGAKDQHKKVSAEKVSTATAPDKAKDELKKVNVDKIAAATAPEKTATDDALDELIGTLGGPEDVPESPKFTGPEIKDKTVTAEFLEELGKREDTIPPEYRHLLDGKGGDKASPPPKPTEPEKSMGDDDLLEALSSDFSSCQAPPDEKKPRLEKKIEAKPVAAALTQPSSGISTEEALDQLLGTLDGPPLSEPTSPEYTGPEVTETITSSYLEELGKRESSIPPAYRKLLDGKDDGKPVTPPAPAQQPEPISDLELVDEFSKDFVSSPTEQTVPAVKPQDTKEEKQSKSNAIVAFSAPSVQAAGASSTSIDDALDELMSTLEGPDLTEPEPVYTGPEITETRTATHVEELGKRESTIPPKYRNLLDGKDDGVEVPLPPQQKPMSDAELADAFDIDFGFSLSPTAPQTPPVKPKDSSEEKKSKADEVVSFTKASLQAAPVLSKDPAPKGDPFDTLSGTLGVRQQDPKDKKPAVDKVKEKTGKEDKEKLGEDENTIPPDYRFSNIKDKDGKPISPKAEVKPKSMSEDELLDALTEGFETSPTTTSKTVPVKPPVKDAGSEEVVSFSKVSTVQSAAPQPTDSDVQIPDDALDLLSGSLGSREVDPDENKPVVDRVKEKATAEHIERLGDRDSTIPPEYRNLLDGKDNGKPAAPALEKDVKPKTPVDSDAAIDALSGSFASCDTTSSNKSQSSSKVKSDKSSPSTPVVQCVEKSAESAKPIKPPSEKPSDQKPSNS